MYFSSPLTLLLVDQPFCLIRENKCCLIYISLLCLFWDLGKQFRPRSDAALSTLFVNMNFDKKYNKSEKYTRHP